MVSSDEVPSSHVSLTWLPSPHNDHQSSIDSDDEGFILHSINGLFLEHVQLMMPLAKPIPTRQW
jgi:hypothetical protein